MVDSGISVNALTKIGKPTGKEEPSVSIVVPNYNGRKYLVKCLSSILKTTRYASFEIVVADDGSQDGSAEEAEKLFSENPIVRIIKLEHAGVSNAMNEGIRNSKGEYVVFVGNDQEFADNWLEELVKTASSDPELGAAQYYIVDYDGKIAFGGVLIPYLALLSAVPIGAIRHEILAHGGMMVKRKVFSLVGNFDTAMQFGLEDFDLSYRIWLAGYKQALCVKSIVYHVGVGKKLTRETVNKRTFESTKNHIRFILKNYSNSNLIKYFPFVIIQEFFIAFLGLVKDRNFSYPWAFVKALKWNVANLKDTLTRRYKIQLNIRRVPDSTIFKAVGVAVSPLFLYRLLLKRKEYHVTLREHVQRKNELIH